MILHKLVPVWSCETKSKRSKEHKRAKYCSKEGCSMRSKLWIINMIKSKDMNGFTRDFRVRRPCYTDSSSFAIHFDTSTKELRESSAHKKRCSNKINYRFRTIYIQPQIPSGSSDDNEPSPKRKKTKRMKKNPD